jgi:hypothetical protein
MNAVATIDHTAAIERFRSARKLVFFCGSAVSIFPPSDLPTGWELVRAIVDSLQQQVRAAFGPTLNVDDLQRLPLETLMWSVFEAAPQASAATRSIARYFAAARPNPVHGLLADFLASRPACHVITTNYDCCVERAWALMPDAAPRALGVTELGAAAFGPQNEIYKIHGCACRDSPDALVLTTQQEASGLDARFQDRLRELFEDALVVFMGYSLSEPDCLEALLTASNFDLVWTDRDPGSFSSNWRAQLLVQQARSACFLQGLEPFAGEALPGMPIHNRLLERMPAPAPETRARGISLFRDVARTGSRAQLLEAIIPGYLQLRDFGRVDTLLQWYAETPGHEPFRHLFWKASIVRDQNHDWEQAASLFRAAAASAPPGSWKRVSAQVEQHGLDTLLAGDDPGRLRTIRDRLLRLTDETGRVSVATATEEQAWMSTLGRVHKNIVQNVARGDAISGKEATLAIAHGKTALRLLREGRNIHPRAETERLLARAHHARFVRTGDGASLQAAVESARRSLLLFTLLGSDMGQVNALRTYAEMLLATGSYAAAEEHLVRLEELVKRSDDALSRLKFHVLQLRLHLARRRYGAAVAAASRCAGILIRRRPRSIGLRTLRDVARRALSTPRPGT